MKRIKKVVVKDFFGNEREHELPTKGTLTVDFSNDGAYPVDTVCFVYSPRVPNLRGFKALFDDDTVTLEQFLPFLDIDDRTLKAWAKRRFGALYKEL